MRDIMTLGLPVGICALILASTILTHGLAMPFWGYLAIAILFEALTRGRYLWKLMMWIGDVSVMAIAFFASGLSADLKIGITASYSLIFAILIPMSLRNTESAGIIRKIASARIYIGCMIIACALGFDRGPALPWLVLLGPLLFFMNRAWDLPTIGLVLRDPACGLFSVLFAAGLLVTPLPYQASIAFIALSCTWTFFAARWALDAGRK